MPLLSVLVPVYNEEATISELLRRLRDGPYPDKEIIVVDDGSTDDSLEIAKRLIDVEPRLRVIELRRNFGQTAGLQAALSCALGDYVVSMDSDLQHFPEDIPKFVDLAEQGFDLICGWRKDRRRARGGGAIAGSEVMIPTRYRPSHSRLRTTFSPVSR